MRLSNNKILITGATAGIGEALLKRFLAYDNQIIALGRNAKKLQLLADSDSRVIPFACDISDENDLDRLAIFLDQSHPDINILINNAGIQFNYHFTTEPQLKGKIDKEINVNLLAPLRLIALTLPLLKLNDNAAIVNVSSGLGLVPKQQAPVYCGTTAGLHIFTRALRHQLNRTKVFEIIPALVDTQMTAGRGKGKISPDQLVDEFIKAFERNQFEVSIGKVKLLKIINRISPALAERIMKRGGEN
ncbi:MAG: SDR family NAD(P)-dependent oxidoreductase [Flavobacteriales bacterium]|nr:SDR family NAD(P)-dependent oxidoreductase [Flavobacteriales bacterium]